MAKPQKIMQLNKPASFRPPNTKFVMMFNAAMTATGFSINDLCVRALAVGLPKVVPQLIAEKQKEEESRRAAEAAFLKFLNEPGDDEAASLAVQKAAQEGGAALVAEIAKKKTRRKP